MFRVANYAQFQFTQANIQRTQSATAINQIQIATGTKAQAYSEMPTQVTELVSLERSIQRSDQFIDNIDQALIRLNTMDSALSVLAERAIDIKSIISQGLSGDTINDLPLQEFATTFSDEIENLLNSQLAGRYIFAGSLTDVPPVDLTDVDYTPQAGLPGTFTADLDYYQGDSYKVKIRADDDYELAYGLTADEPAFEELLRTLSYMDYAGQNLDKTVLEEAFNLVDSAIDGISDLRGQVGANSQVLEKANQGHKDFTTFATNLASGIEDVDIAQATSELAFNQVQLQGSYLALSRLQSLSLLNFL